MCSELWSLLFILCLCPKSKKILGMEYQSWWDLKLTWLWAVDGNEIFCGLEPDLWDKQGPSCYYGFQSMTVNLGLAQHLCYNQFRNQSLNQCHYGCTVSSDDIQTGDCFSNVTLRQQTHSCYSSSASRNLEMGLTSLKRNSLIIRRQGCALCKPTTFMANHEYHAEWITWIHCQNVVTGPQVFAQQNNNGRKPSPQCVVCNLANTVG